MQSDYPRYIMRQRRIQTMAIGANHHSKGITVTVAYALVIAIGLLWGAQLSSVTSSILSKLNMTSKGPAVSSSAIIRENKGDRLPAVTFGDRWNSLGKLDTLRPAATIPSLCRPGARCAAKAKVYTKLAIAE